jgi:hypothetical protein
MMAMAPFGATARIKTIQSMADFGFAKNREPYKLP